MWKVVNYFNTQLVCIVTENAAIISKPFMASQKDYLDRLVGEYNGLVTAQETIKGTDETSDLFSIRNRKS